MSPVDYRYCPHCGAELKPVQVLHQQRPGCVACGFVHFRDPKVAVVGLVTQGDRVLLIRRGVDPGKGRWALPGGYMDAGEMPVEALQRELNEEVGLAVTVQQLLDIYPMAGAQGPSRGIVLAYAAVPAASPLDPELQPLTCRDDVTDAAWFTGEELPTDLAFDSTHALLAAWHDRRPYTMTHPDDKGVYKIR